MFWDVFEPFREQLWFSGAWLTIVDAQYGNSPAVSENGHAVPAAIVDDTVSVFIALAFSLTICRFPGDACTRGAFEGQAGSVSI